MLRILRICIYRCCCKPRCVEANNVGILSCNSLIIRCNLFKMTSTFKWNFIFGSVESVGFFKISTDSKFYCRMASSSAQLGRSFKLVRLWIHSSLFLTITFIGYASLKCNCFNIDVIFGTCNWPQYTLQLLSCINAVITKQMSVRNCGISTSSQPLEAFIIISPWKHVLMKIFRWFIDSSLYCMNNFRLSVFNASQASRILSTTVAV